MQRQITLRRGVLVLAVLSSFGAMLVCPPAGRGDLGSRERALEQGVGQDTSRIGADRGRLRDLHSRLASIESSLAIQQTLLAREYAARARNDGAVVVLPDARQVAIPPILTPTAIARSIGVRRRSWRSCHTGCASTSARARPSSSSRPATRPGRRR